MHAAKRALRGAPGARECAAELPVSLHTLMLTVIWTCSLQMLFTQLGNCNARLLAVGGMCPDNSDALYAKDFPKEYSRKELINHGVWVTHKELAKRAAKAQEDVHHHFS